MRKKIVGLKGPFEHLDGIRYDNIRAIKAVALSLLILATKAVGAPISDPGALSALQTTTVTFEDLAGVNEEQFGFGAGQPYINLGLTMGNQIVTVGANLGSMSGGIAVRSATVYTADNLNYQMLRFSSLQQGIGFYFRDNLATSVTIEACGQLGNPLESFTLPASTTTRYGGFLRLNADIHEIDIRAPHLTVDDAFQSRTFVDDLSFTPVPEPSISALATIGFLVFLCLSWAKRKRQSKLPPDIKSDGSFQGPGGVWPERMRTELRLPLRR